MEFPRYSFRVTASNLAKILKKQWPKQVEGLIFEKSRRKSSQTSGAEKQLDSSANDSSFHFGS